MEMQISPCPRCALTLSAASFSASEGVVQLHHELGKVAVERADGDFFIHSIPLSERLSSSMVSRVGRAGKMPLPGCAGSTPRRKT